MKKMIVLILIISTPASVWARGLDSWLGRWDVSTQHYTGSLTLQDGYEWPTGRLSLTQRSTGREYMSCSSLSATHTTTDRQGRFGAVRNSQIRIHAYCRRPQDNSRYVVTINLARYTTPRGTGNRAVGYMQLSAGTGTQAGGAWSPIEFTKY